MSRRGDTVLVAALKRYGTTMQKYIQNSLHKDMKVKLLIEDARDSQGKASGAVYLEIEIDKKDGWGGENQVEIHGTIGFDKSGKKGKKEDEAYLDGVTVGNWDVGSRAIGLTGCSIGEFLVHMFTLFAIKAGNESVLLDNAAGPTGEYIYRQVGFIKSKGARVQYGEDNEMIFPLTGKKKNKDAGQLWRERYNKFRKKLAIKIKNNENCKFFWKSVPTALEAPGPVHILARGSKRRTRRRRGGNGKNNKTKKQTNTKCAGIRNAFGQCMKAASKRADFNKRVISAQDTSLGQPTTQFAPMLMGYPSDKGGGRKRRGGYGPGITPEQARRMRIRDERRREAERRQQIQQALAREERARRARIRREADTLRRANQIIPNRDITDLHEAQEIIDDHERHERFIHSLIPEAVETKNVPYAREVNRSLRSYIPGSSKIPMAEGIDEGKIPMATEVERVRVGGRKTKRRRKKHKKTRRR